MKYGEIYDRAVRIGYDYDLDEKKMPGMCVRAAQDEIKVTIDCRGGDHHFYFHPDTEEDNELEWEYLETLLNQLVKEDEE